MVKLRVGVIGVGNWAVQSHLPTLAQENDLEFVCAVGTNATLLEAVRAEYGFEMTSQDYRDASTYDLDVCVISSPPVFHFEHARAALRWGCHVLVEKPMTVDPDEAWALVETADQMNRGLVVAFGWNYLPLVVRAKSLMSSRGIGELELLSTFMSSPTRELLAGTYSTPADSSLPSPDRATYASRETAGGGYGQAQLPHALGISLWLSGARVDSAFALMAPESGAVEMHDAICYRYENGAVGTLTGGSSHLNVNGNKHALQVRAIGSRGQLLLDLEREALWFAEGDEDLREVTVPNEGVYTCTGPIKAILERARGNEYQSQSPGELGARTVEAIALAYRSVATGQLASRLTTSTRNGEMAG
jgi:predicted dehydrogenase